MRTKTSPIPALLSVDDIATTMGVSTKTVRRLIDGGQLISHRIGKLIRVSQEDLQTFLRLRRA